MGSMKKHKKHKKDKYEDKSMLGERPTALRLILKVGSSSTPEHSDSPGPVSSNCAITGDDESLHSSSSFHKKSKKKKKKKDRDHDKHDKKKKHHHKDKKRKYEDNSSEDAISVSEDTMIESPSLSIVHYNPVEKQDLNVASDQQGNREPRLCVQLLRQKQTRSPLMKTLEYLQRQLEKKDPQHFFAWPVTDQIAPGYSKTISHPMDFSTMRQKIDSNSYKSINDYISDLKLMCNNAMTYNMADTVYYKSAKRLLHAGLKMLSPEKIKQLSTTVKCINEVPLEQLGIQAKTGHQLIEYQSPASPRKVESGDENPSSVDHSSPKRKQNSNMPESRFQAIQDDLTPEQILEHCQKAARDAGERLSAKKIKTNMTFLRHEPDGSTSLAILIPSSVGVESDDSDERPITISHLVGKLAHGSSALLGTREDRKNVVKTVKPLNYGAFGSYAPSYDSTFANLTKEETDLIYETYGDENSTSYAESVLNFAKDCDYTLTMVDNLLDLLTGGEHRKAISVIDEQKKYREEEEKVRDLMESKIHLSIPLGQEALHGHSFVKAPTSPGISPVAIEVGQLKTLADIGIDISFLKELDNDSPPASAVVSQSPAPHNAAEGKLSQSTALIEKLNSAQSERLTSPTGTHLDHILPPSENDIHIAEKLSESLTELAKQVPPGALIHVPAIRKAMGITSETISVSTSTSASSPIQPSVVGVVLETGDSSEEDEPCVGVGQLDLESELREFLESDTALSNFPLHDDKTIEEMLSES